MAESNARIRKLTFNGFRTPDRRAGVEFSKDPISVIYGDNGCGKTTFLKAINAFLSQDNSFLEALSVDSVDCEYNWEGADHTISVVKKKLLYDWAAFEKSPLADTRSISLGVERGITTQNIRIDSDLLYNFFMRSPYRTMFRGAIERDGRTLHEMAAELSRFIRIRQRNSRVNRSEIDFSANHVNLQNIKLENIEQLLLEHYNYARRIAALKIQNALFDTLAVAIQSTVGRTTNVSFEEFMEKLSESRTRLIEVLDDDTSNTFKDMIIEKLKELEDKNNYIELFNNDLLLTLLWNMVEELKFEKTLLDSINILVDNFNEYLIDDKKLIIADDKIFIDFKGRELQINDLSSGERHMLTFLSLVMLQTQSRSFLIIDEPEISLNIKWQRELLSIFHDMAPNTQIIVASHSPAIAKNNPNCLCELKSSKIVAPRKGGVL